MKLFMHRMMNLMKLEADGGGGNGGGGTGGDGSGGQGGGGGESSAKFTQEDLNRIGATEKAAGKLAALKALGFESEDDAKKYVEAARKKEKDEMSETEKAKKEKEDSDKVATAEKQRADLLEQKIAALGAGANPKTVDDLVVLVRNRVNDTVDFAKALETVKKEAAFATFFAAGGSEGGDTGGDGNPPRGKGGTPETKGMGKRLAESKAKSNTDAQNGFKGYFTQN